MRVVMVETGGWGGLAHYAWNLCAALDEAGAEVSLLTNARYELDELPRRFTVERCVHGGRRYPANARGLWRRLRELAPDVVHVQSLLSTRLDALLWPLVARRAALVATLHNVSPHEAGSWETWTSWRTRRAADAVVAHTRESADAATARLGPGARVVLIRHGDYAFFGAGGVPRRDEARRALDLPPEDPVVLAFGAIRPYKDLLGLLAALPAVRARHPGVRLVIAGPLLVGSEAPYREAIGRAGLGPAVDFRAGYVPHRQVAAYFAAADVAVYNYRAVTDSGALRIACSLGCPVVASRVGGFAEFLTDGVTGRLVEPGNGPALAQAIGDVLADPTGAARMALAARRLAATTWSWRESAQATLVLYEELVRARAAGDGLPGIAVGGGASRP